MVLGAALLDRDAYGDARRRRPALGASSRRRREVDRRRAPGQHAERGAPPRRLPPGRGSRPRRRRRRARRASTPAALARRPRCFVPTPSRRPSTAARGDDDRETEDADWEGVRTARSGPRTEDATTGAPLGPAKATTRSSRRSAAGDARQRTATYSAPTKEIGRQGPSLPTPPRDPQTATSPDEVLAYSPAGLGHGPSNGGRRRRWSLGDVGLLPQRMIR